MIRQYAESHTTSGCLLLITSFSIAKKTPHRKRNLQDAKKQTGPMKTPTNGKENKPRRLPPSRLRRANSPLLTPNSSLLPPPSHSSKIVKNDRKPFKKLLKNAQFVVFAKKSKKVWKYLNLSVIILDGFADAMGRTGKTSHALPLCKEKSENLVGGTKL